MVLALACHDARPVAEHQAKRRLGLGCYALVVHDTTAKTRTSLPILRLVGGPHTGSVEVRLGPTDSGGFWDAPHRTWNRLPADSIQIWISHNYSGLNIRLVSTAADSVTGVEQSGIDVVVEGEPPYTSLIAGRMVPCEAPAT